MTIQKDSVLLSDKEQKIFNNPKNLVALLITKRFSNLNGKSTILSRKLLTKKYILFVCPKERLFPATIKQLCNYPTHKTALESWKNQRVLMKLKQKLFLKQHIIHKLYISL